WDLEAGKELAANDEAHLSALDQIAVTEKLTVTAGQDGTIRIWETTSGKQLHKLEQGNGVRAIALSHDGSKVASSGLDYSVCIWDVESGKRIHKLPGHGDDEIYAPCALSFTPDGKHVLCWGAD